MITALLLAVLSQLGVCKSGQPCQTSSYQSQRNPIDRCTSLADGGVNQGVRGLLEFDYRDGGGYAQCNGRKWIALPGRKTCGLGSFVTTLAGDDSVCAAAFQNPDGGTFIGVNAVTATLPIVSSGGTSPDISFDLPSVISPTDGGWTLYVNGGSGSDSNASCFATGAGACATIQSAMNRIPKYLRYQATINVAAGNYAGFTVSGFVIDPGFQRATAGILIDGALANVTPTTGSATGTATGGTAGTAPGFGTLIDSGATWTVNDAAIVGKFLLITGGTGSGQQKVIISNTATTLTIAGAWTATTGTSTYAIQSPSVIITSAAAAIPKPQTGTEIAAAGIQILDNVTGASRIAIRNIAISLTATAGIIATSGGVVEGIGVLTSTTTGNGFLINKNSVGTLTACSATNTTFGTGFNTSGAEVNVAASYFATGTTGGAIVVGGGGRLILSGTLMKGQAGLTLGSGASAQLTSANQVDCLSAATSYGFSIGGSIAAQTTSGTNAFNSLNIIASSSVTNCSYGLSAVGASGITVSSTTVISGNALIYGVSAVGGASVTLPTAAATITGVTAETAVDNGVATATLASYAASYDCLLNTSTTSRVCRQ